VLEIKKENYFLKDELNKQQKKTVTQFKTKQSNIKSLQYKRLNLVQQIEQEYINKSKLEEDLIVKEQKLKQQRTDIANHDVNKFDSKPKKIKVLKTIVEKKYLKLNECAADIKLQRDKISELRKERTL